MRHDAQILLGIEEHMKQKGINQAELARRLDVRPQSVSQVFTGKRAVITTTLENMLDALGLELVVQPKTTKAEDVPASQMPPS
jgi:predicted XRE-type DNA-binding protein